MCCKQQHGIKEGSAANHVRTTRETFSSTIAAFSEVFLLLDLRSQTIARMLAPHLHSLATKDEFSRKLPEKQLLQRIEGRQKNHNKLNGDVEALVSVSHLQQEMKNI